MVSEPTPSRTCAASRIASQVVFCGHSVAPSFTRRGYRLRRASCFGGARCVARGRHWLGFRAVVRGGGVRLCRAKPVVVVGARDPVPCVRRGRRRARSRGRRHARRAHHRTRPRRRDGRRARRRDRWGRRRSLLRAVGEVSREPLDPACSRHDRGHHRGLSGRVHAPLTRALGDYTAAVALDTKKRSAEPGEIARNTSEHLFVSWSAQGGLKQVVIDRADGSGLYSGQRRILDFSSGLVNVNLGHSHPKVVRAIQEQAEKLCYVTPGFGEEQRAELARLMAEVTPGDLTKTLFTTGGTEANKQPIRIALMF